MKRKNYLFSTTRQWNPGDEFILQGILRVFREIDSGFNPVIFNRSPEIKHKEGSEFNFQVEARNLRIKRLKSGFYENSFKKELLSDNFIDLVVFAGTPEWASDRMKVLYDYINKYSIPTIFLGIGVGSEDFDFKSVDEQYKSVIRTASLITVRDRAAEKALADLGAVYLPCPALLSAPAVLERKRIKAEKIGLIYMNNTGVRSNTLNSTDYRFLVDFYKKILLAYKGTLSFQFVCHYINELHGCLEDFPEEAYYYSYDSGEYANIYSQFDFVVGPRVHGIGLAASTGAPGLSIQHDVRANTCSGFMADIIKISDGIDKAIQVFDSKIKQPLSEWSGSVLAEKNAVLKKYTDLLKPIIKSQIFR